MGDRVGFSITCYGSAARALIAAGGAGRVAAVFARSFYLEGAAGMACVGGGSLGLGPLNAVCDAPSGIDWPASGLLVGAAYRTAGDRLHVGDRFVFSTAAAVTWTPPPCPAGWRPDTLRRSLDDLDRRVANLVPKEGLAPLVFGGDDSAVGRAAQAPVAGLRDWLAAEAPGDPSQWVRALIGLGPGLTPSGDDFLGGIMIVLHVLGRRPALADLAVAVRASASATNPISRAHLVAAAHGQGSAAVHDLLDGLLRGEPSGLDDRLDAVDRIGHCSGWDALAGVVTALRPLQLAATEAA
jgi:hypothetical protein